METKGKIIIGVLIILVAVAIGYLVLSFFDSKPSLITKLDRSSSASLEAYESFDLKVGEKKSFSLSKHKVSITYLENSPKQKLKIVLDGQEEIIEIEKKECFESFCKTCYEYGDRTECKNYDNCQMINNVCLDNSTDKNSEFNYTCKIQEEKSDCHHLWTKDKINLGIKPLIIAQDLDKDGKICEDPRERAGVPECGATSEWGPQIDNDGDGLVNEDYQEKYYFRNNWNTDLFEFSAWIAPTCPPDVFCTAVLS